jgi:hypothetical protein
MRRWGINVHLSLLDLRKMGIGRATGIRSSSELRILVLKYCFEIDNFLALSARDRFYH